MASVMLPKFVVLNVPVAGTNTYVYCKDDGSVAEGQDSMFSPLVKIEVERAKSGNNNVHLRFCYTNKYWQKSANSTAIVATSNVPEEDTTKPTCTLFVPTQSGGILYFTNVYTGWLVMLNSTTKAFYVQENSAGAPLGYVDWSTLVKLPRRLAFKGDNGQYLRHVNQRRIDWLQYSSDDPNRVDSSHEISLMNDGYVRIQTDSLPGLFWRRSPNWIWIDSSDQTANDADTLFWPVKVDNTTIALRNKGNNNFCKRLTDYWISCLNAGVSTITTEAKMQVQELVAARKIYNVVYRMENARIYGETPYLAGTTTADNYGDKEASIAVSIGYQNSVSSSFNRSISLSLGVTTTITAGVPEIASTSVQISSHINTEFQWGTTTTTTTSITATGTVPVEPNTRATVSYVGTMGTCDVPFSYTQQDQSSTSGAISETDQIDGVYTGVNCYNFKFKIEKTEPLGGRRLPPNNSCNIFC